MADVPGFIGNSSIWSLVPDSCSSRVDPSKATEEGADQFYRRWSNFVSVRHQGGVHVHVRIAMQPADCTGPAWACLSCCDGWRQHCGALQVGVSHGLAAPPAAPIQLHSCAPLPRASRAHAPNPPPLHCAPLTRSL